jgi:hypothetical protein
MLVGCLAHAHTRVWMYGYQCSVPCSLGHLIGVQYPVQEVAWAVLSMTAQLVNDPGSLESRQLGPEGEKRLLWEEDGVPSCRISRAPAPPLLSLPSPFSHALTWWHALFNAKHLHKHVRVCRVFLRLQPC